MSVTVYAAYQPNSQDPSRTASQPSQPAHPAPENAPAALFGQYFSPAPAPAPLPDLVTTKPQEDRKYLKEARDIVTLLEKQGVPAVESGLLRKYLSELEDRLNPDATYDDPYDEGASRELRTALAALRQAVDTGDCVRYKGERTQYYVCGSSRRNRESWTYLDPKYLHSKYLDSKPLDSKYV